MTMQVALIFACAAYGFGQLAGKAIRGLDNLIWRLTFPRPVHPAALTTWQSITICADHGRLLATLYCAAKAKVKAQYALKAVAGHILMIDSSVLGP